MTFLKQLAYTGDIALPTKEGGLQTVTLTKELFSDMVIHFQNFKKKGMPVPVTNKHFSNNVNDTLGYVTALWEQKDKQGRDALYCAIDFNEQPDKNIVNAGASLESLKLFLVPSTGEIICNPLTAVTVTPTPVIAGMEPFTLALSLGSDGGIPAAATNHLPMFEQLATLLFEFLGVDPMQYEGKETELLEVVAKSLAELKKTPEPEPVIEAPVSEQEPVQVEVEAKEPDEKDEKIEALTLSLNSMRQKFRMDKLNQLASQGKLSKPAFDKAKKMYGGNLALARDNEFNDVMQLIEANAPVVNTKSLTKMQVLPVSTTDDPLARAQEAKYGKKK